jgi:hypothetical protein
MYKHINYKPSTYLTSNQNTLYVACGKTFIEAQRLGMGRDAGLRASLPQNCKQLLYDKKIE